MPKPTHALTLHHTYPSRNWWISGAAALTVRPPTRHMGGREKAAPPPRVWLQPVRSPGSARLRPKARQRTRKIAMRPEKCLERTRSATVLRRPPALLGLPQCVMCTCSCALSKLVSGAFGVSLTDRTPQDLTGNKPGVPLVRVSNSVDDLSPTRSNSMYTVRRCVTLALLRCGSPSHCATPRSSYICVGAISIHQHKRRDWLMWLTRWLTHRSGVQDCYVYVTVVPQRDV